MPDLPVLSMAEQTLAGQRLLVRADLNVPIEGGVVVSDARIRAVLPTLRLGLDAGAALILLSHLGRPEEGQPDARLSLKPVAVHLAGLLDRPVRFESDWLDGLDIEPGEIVLCENVRFNVGEKANDPALARRLAQLCDIFVMDAFGTAHRAHASTHGVARFAPLACAGPLLTGELQALDRSLRDPATPVVAIVGGSKVSTKLALLETLARKVDRLIVGGGIANTFIAAAGHEVGKSLYEPELIEKSRALIRASTSRAEIPMPLDVVVATALAEAAPGRVCPLGAIGADEMIVDIGPATAVQYAGVLAHAGTIVWNGPVGVFEIDAFSAGTRAVAEAVAASDAFSIAGGGDTLAALDRFGLAGEISYLSTGGGAFLEYLEGKTLPAVAILQERAAAG